MSSLTIMTYKIFSVIADPKSDKMIVIAVTIILCNPHYCTGCVISHSEMWGGACQVLTALYNTFQLPLNVNILVHSY